MATIGEELIIELISASDVFALTSDRIHQNHIPQQSSYPSIWFSRRSELKSTTFDGDDDPVKTRFDIECLAETQGDAIDLSIAVDGALHGKRGTFGNGSVQGVFVENKSDDYIPQNDASDDGIIAVGLDVSIWHITT